MTESMDAGRIFGAAEIKEDWRKLPRSEMFERVIVAVEGAKDEAREAGAEHYVRYVDEVLLPFLEAELENARDRTEPPQEEEEEVETTDYRGVLEDLARSRGLSGARALAQLAHEAHPRHSVRKLLESPQGGFGNALDAVLEMNEEEKVRVSAAFASTFMRPERLPRVGERED